MYPDCPDRPTWQQETALSERVSPLFQAQTDWFSLQEAPPHQHEPSPLIQQQQSPGSGWIKDAGSGANYTTNSRYDEHEYGTLPITSSELAPTPFCVWTDESHQVQSPRVQTQPFLSPPLFVRPGVTPVTTEELYEHVQDGKPSVQQYVGRRRSKPIAVGRWHSDEHQCFLKGLEMFQGPAWGEIARLIGTRTSTQVRTHAQKFFTKLARLNQTMPHFELQIQKERARLLAQGASLITPTAQQATSRALPLATLSPCKHLDSHSLRQTLKEFRDEALPLLTAAVEGRDPQEEMHHLMLPRGDVDPSAGGEYTSPSSESVMSTEWTHHQWTSCEHASHWPLTSPTSTTVSLQLPATQLGNDRLQHSRANSVESNVDSLPSMTKLLYRSSTASS
uniref:Uncharacterized protein n=1 Tax=Hyaloperonospora arabidopsidis (strain Emoy2) TaxID=559515 RepID=M4C0G6_HYAAE